MIILMQIYGQFLNFFKLGTLILHVSLEHTDYIKLFLIEDTSIF